MITIAHRGSWRRRPPENGLAAIVEAGRQGFGVEIDVRRTRDDVLVLHHDGKMEQTHGLSLAIEESSSQQTEGLCTLRDALQDAPPDTRCLFLHLKKMDLLDAAVSVITTVRKAERCVFFADGDSSMPFFCKCLERHPNIHVALHIRSADEFRTTRALPIKIRWLDEADGGWITEEVIKGAQDDRSQVFVVSPECFDPRQTLSSLRSRWNTWKHWKVTGICTDWPEELHSTLSE